MFPLKSCSPCPRYVLFTMSPVSTGSRTQGSASLHPWATILRRFAAQRLQRGPTATKECPRGRLDGDPDEARTSARTHFRHRLLAVRLSSPQSSTLSKPKNRCFHGLRHTFVIGLTRETERFANSNTNRSGFGPFVMKGVNLKKAVQADRNNWYAEPLCHEPDAAFERLHSAVGGAFSFRENERAESLVD